MTVATLRVFCPCRADPRLIDRLDALMSVLSVAQGHYLRHPFQLIHAEHNSSVHSLEDALDPQYDELYARLSKFRYADHSMH